MFCQKCGAKNPDGATFCSSCGTAIEAPTVNYAPAVKENKVPYWSAAVAAIVAFFGWLFFPWLTASAYGESESISFFDLFEDYGSDGDWFMIFFVVSMIFAVLAIITIIRTLTKKNIGVLNMVTGILGIACFFMMVFEANSDVYTSAFAWGISVSVGFGVWLMLIGGIGMVVLRVLSKKK